MLGLTDIMQRLPDSTWMGEPLVGGLALFPGSLGMRLLWELVCLSVHDTLLQLSLGYGYCKCIRQHCG